MSGIQKLKAPFPYFGGKKAVAELVWARLGDPRNFIEPFCGSAAMLLLRPHPPKIETINDADPYVANFWRATEYDRDGVVEYADWPVNEADLHARHLWLVKGPEAPAFRERMKTDPGYFDARFAGWWVWGICCWIGAGWCTAHGATTDGGRKQPTPDTSAVSHGRGVHKNRPQLSGYGEGRGVHSGGKLPRLTGGRRGDECYGGLGVHAEARPQLADAYARGRGVHANDDAETCAARRAWLLEWFGRLRDRLRCVRVCCGDWERVCGSRSTTTRLGMTGVFLDPPYGEAAKRSADLYGVDCQKVAGRVQKWCAEHGDDPQMRIALCGFEGEHEALEGAGWDVESWRSQGGYGNRGDENTNRERERIWFSPHCERDPEPTLFAQHDEGNRR